MKNAPKTGSCICPFCNGEISTTKSAVVSICKPCGINFVTCAKCGGIMAETILTCPKCGEKRKVKK